jgi:hypothetical protein
MKTITLFLMMALSASASDVCAVSLVGTWHCKKAADNKNFIYTLAVNHRIEAEILSTDDDLFELFNRHGKMMDRYDDLGAAMTAGEGLGKPKPVVQKSGPCWQYMNEGYTLPSVPIDDSNWSRSYE